MGYSSSGDFAVVLAVGAGGERVAESIATVGPNVTDFLPRHRAVH